MSIVGNLLVGIWLLFFRFVGRQIYFSPPVASRLTSFRPSYSLNVQLRTKAVSKWRRPRHHTLLRNCRMQKQITKGKHRKLKLGDGQCNLAPSNEKDWKEIYFFPRVS